MAKLKLRGKDLRAIGYPEGPVISIAMNTMEKFYKHEQEEKVLDVLKEILNAPAQFVNHEVPSPIAKQLMPKPKLEGSTISLNEHAIAFNVFGSENIEEGAMKQMNQAARLPVAVAGALMPDAHAGYGLPIGGVLATQNAVIPYGVGVDIGCRMCISIFDINPAELLQKEKYFLRQLDESTLFGSGKEFDFSAEHEVIERKEFDDIPLLRGLQRKAARQLGSSGSGNHFAEFGIVEIERDNEIPGVAAGNYIGFLTHSGSRALGANIANHYTKIAKEKRRLPNEAANLAWLNLDEEEGVEYWQAMNLAGDYAAACHHVMHSKIANQLGKQPISIVENHHNFAWKEMLEGKEAIVHRKGATPAGKGVLGIIPGSMTAPGFIVKGKGELASLSSAAHGAGRRMSRTAAMNTITQQAMKEMLQKHGVVLSGGGLDEAPHAYKDIEMVMQSQKHLVDIAGKFIPKIVKMDGTPHKTWRKKDKGIIEGE
jgi:tRNA-splicing ligase RtcB (3'-phosphate/5'-hydroxy nucleic acid ligase)